MENYEVAFGNGAENFELRILNSTAFSSHSKQINLGLLWG